MENLGPKDINGLSEKDRQMLEPGAKGEKKPGADAKPDNVRSQDSREAGVLRKMARIAKDKGEIVKLLAMIASYEHEVPGKRPQPPIQKTAIVRNEYEGQVGTSQSKAIQSAESRPVNKSQAFEFGGKQINVSSRSQEKGTNPPGSAQGIPV
ncbi:MAG: hypothetical protein WCT32_03255 [Patescibacteria group bacterium]|jgi:hypothetical protein